MRWRLVAAGTKLPGWVDAAYADYAARFGPELKLELRDGQGNKKDLKLRFKQ